MDSISQNKNTEQNQGYLTGAIIFCVIILIIFVLGATMNIPTSSPTDIASLGVNSFNNHNLGKYYYLYPDDYTVLCNFDEFVTTDSTYMLTKIYYYFNVLVTDNSGEQFIMAVRTDDKTEYLKSGTRVTLCGMVSDLEDDVKDKQLKYVNESTIDVIPKCLNDNDTTPSTNKSVAIICTIISILDIILIMFLYKKKINNKVR